MRSTAAREAADREHAGSAAGLSKGRPSDSGLRAFDSLLRALPAGAQLFALLSNNRQLLDLLATILGAPATVGDVPAAAPTSSCLIEPAIQVSLYVKGGARRAACMLGWRTRSASRTFSIASAFAAEHRFLISVRLLRGILNAAEAGMAFSDLAETVLRHLFHHTLIEFERQHGRVAGGRAAILAFGRVGQPRDDSRVGPGPDRDL
jgi:glutamate-ammonia-ligase adenylyltransferase